MSSGRILRGRPDARAWVIPSRADPGRGWITHGSDLSPAAGALGLLDTGALIDPARHDEQQVAEPVEEADEAWLDDFLLPERDQPALGPAAHGAREVELGSQLATAREDEVPERRKPGVEPVDPALERFDVRLADALEALEHRGLGGGQLGTHAEQTRLERAELLGEPLLTVERARRAQGRIELVHAPVGLDSRRALGHAPGPEEAGGAVVAGARVDLHAAESKRLRALRQRSTARGEGPLHRLLHREVNRRLLPATAACAIICGHVPPAIPS